jgi:hypothetical protein
MARNRGLAKHHGHHKKKFTIPLAIVAGFIPAVANAHRYASTYGWPQSIMRAGGGLIGYDTITGHYDGWSRMQESGTPQIAIGFFVHFLASRLGVNRMIAQAGIPIIRL